MESMKLYVDNLPPSTSASDLENLFSPYGAVLSARVQTTRYGGHTRGFGYVEMTKKNAERAMSALHGQRLDSTVLQVSEVKS